MRIQRGPRTGATGMEMSSGRSLELTSHAGALESQTRPEPSATPLIVVAGVRKEYSVRMGNPVLALDGISFDVADGEFVSLVGPSGCGKSTLLQIFAGILPATKGQVMLKGKPIAGPQRDVGVVFQEPVLLPWLKVIDNVMLPAVVHGLERRSYRDRARELLQLVKLQGFEERYPYELSGGMQQRVSIARALLTD